MLEDTSGAISALGRIGDEVLAHRSQVLLVEALLWLQFFLAVSEPTAILLLSIFTLLSDQPELA